MHIPTDFCLDAQTFEDILDLEEAVRLAMAGPQVPGAPSILDIQDAWSVLEGKLPSTVDAYLTVSVKRMFEAFNQRDVALMQAEQERIAARLSELRRTAR
ncbi:hypothetical protein MTR62_12545 [Novosphingobium sp. 1949]|uniref:Uncharacterized protein n=1 Tax=Novosphingobium organovorum TaxID=2930092 RepID=A0ABT0BF88_9SPHN|nr:hypothetical protein [Novosphingobium organovorum]MCJ2183513.1 hypothetical protein [Novosphingobium organovorum]